MTFPYYLDKYVQIGENALSPLVGDKWETIEKRFTAKQFAKLTSKFIIELKKPARNTDKIKVTLWVPKPETGVKGYNRIINFPNFTY